MTHRPWLLYGAYGYTGRLIAEVAVARGMRPVLGGRDSERTRAMADDLGLEARVFSLEDEVQVRAGLEGMWAVLHSAGPFSKTWRPMAHACLAEGCHYLDVTGEIGVLEGIQVMDADVAAAGLHFIPAVGFDVVPTDCAAAMVADALDDPIELELAFHASGGPSRGTARTALEGMGKSGAVRRDGRIVPVPMGSITRTIPFSKRPREGVAIPWGDVSSAYRTTGIPNIRVYTTLSARAARTGRWLRPLLGLTPVQALARRYVDAKVQGPSAEQLEKGYAVVWAQAREDSGRSASVEIQTPNGYRLTALTAVAAIDALARDEIQAEPGVTTPARAFGAEWVLGIPGVQRVSPITIG